MMAGLPSVAELPAAAEVPTMAKLPTMAELPTGRIANGGKNQVRMADTNGRCQWQCQRRHMTRCRYITDRNLLNSLRILILLNWLTVHELLRISLSWISILRYMRSIINVSGGGRGSVKSFYWGKTAQ